MKENYLSKAQQHIFEAQTNIELLRRGTRNLDAAEEIRELITEIAWSLQDAVINIEKQMGIRVESEDD